MSGQQHDPGQSLQDACDAFAKAISQALAGVAEAQHGPMGGWSWHWSTSPQHAWVITAGGIIDAGPAVSGPGVDIRLPAYTLRHADLILLVLQLAGALATPVPLERRPPTQPDQPVAGAYPSVRGWAAAFAAEHGTPPPAPHPAVDITPLVHQIADRTAQGETVTVTGGHGDDLVFRPPARQVPPVPPVTGSDIPSRGEGITEPPQSGTYLDVKTAAAGPGNSTSDAIRATRGPAAGGWAAAKQTKVGDYSSGPRRVDVDHAPVPPPDTDHRPSPGPRRPTASGAFSILRRGEAIGGAHTPEARQRNLADDPPPETVVPPE